MNFTFLTDRQIFGNEQLDIIKKYGTKCAMTDFSILLGGEIKNEHYTSDGNSLDNRSGMWWTKSYFLNCVKVVNNSGVKDEKFSSNRDVGARPAFSCLPNFPGGIRDKNGILEVEYGEYPQTVVSEDFSEILESSYENMLHSNSELKRTGKSYTTDSFLIGNDVFQAKSHPEYEYKGKKYIR